MNWYSSSLLQWKQKNSDQFLAHISNVNTSCKLIIFPLVNICIKFRSQLGQHLLFLFLSILFSFITLVLCCYKGWWTLIVTKNAYIKWKNLYFSDQTEMVMGFPWLTHSHVSCTQAQYFLNSNEVKFIAKQHHSR